MMFTLNLRRIRGAQKRRNEGKHGRKKTIRLYSIARNFGGVTWCLDDSFRCFAFILPALAASSTALSFINIQADDQLTFRITVLNLFFYSTWQEKRLKKMLLLLNKSSFNNHINTFINHYSFKNIFQQAISLIYS